MLRAGTTGSTTRWAAPVLAVLATLGVVYATSAMRGHHAPGTDRLARSVPASQVTAARFSLVTTGLGTFNFSELAGMNSEVQPQQYISTNSGILHTKQFGKAKPPTLVLRKTLSTDTAGRRLFQWHQLAASDNPNARMDAQLVVTDSEGKPVETFQLQHAWVSKIQIAGIKAGGSTAVTETVTIVADQITLQ